MSDSSPMSKPQVPSLTFLTTLEKRKDPVCGMMVAAEKAAAKIEHAGNTYYFCSTRCAERFSDEPEKFLAAPGTAGMEQGPAHAEHGAARHSGATASRAATDEKKIRYTCPMHPQIIQIGPGSCPICGMALEPKEVTLEDLPDAELIDMRRRFWISAMLTLPVFLLVMGEMFAPSARLF